MSERGTGDADQALAEADGKPVRMTWKGRGIELPPSLPAIVMIRLVRLRRERGDEGDVDVETAVEMLEGIFGGADNLDRALMDCSVGVDELPDFLDAAMTAYNPSQGNRAARRAKRPAGRRST